MEVPRLSGDHRGVLNDPFERILGESGAAQAIRTFGRRAARVDAPVLLLGESGTGKGVLARAIHEGSGRAKGPFVAVNCAAIPDALFESEFFGHVRGAFTGAQYAHKGLFEQAHGGTLFLDEVGELPLIAQAKLLTTIEDRIVRKVGAERTAEVNVRIVAATAADLQSAVLHREFRRDLYHRLRVLNFTIPPLRDRYGDIVLLARMFTDRFASDYGKSHMTLSPAALDILEAWSWPGNVRELAHAIESAVIACETDDIPGFTLDASPPDKNPPEKSDTFAPRRRYSYGGSAIDEQRMIATVLARCAGNKTLAAAELGMSRNTLLNKLRRTAMPA